MLPNFLSASIRVRPIWLLLLALHSLSAASFRFVILGDRTGEAQPGVFAQVSKETAADHPAFIVSVGDNIQGLDDATADQEWRGFEKIIAPYKGIPLYLTPGNHDIWSALSEKLFQKYSGHPPHYSFDYQQVHFTILDNSRSDLFSPAEMAFLADDLRAHEQQPVKFIFSHRPSWLVQILLKDPTSPFHRLLKKYGVQYVVSGHIHQMLHTNFEGIAYLSMPSAGGHLRGTEKYEDGWFFAHTLVEVDGAQIHFQVKELHLPHGEGRITALDAWGASGLLHR